MAKLKVSIFLSLFICIAGFKQAYSTNISDYTFLIANVGEHNFENRQLWNLLERNQSTGIQIEIETNKNQVVLAQSNITFLRLLDKINTAVKTNPAKIIPVFLKFNGNVLLLDSVINKSELASAIFYLPQGETWPSMEYLVQANRRAIFFVSGDFKNESRVLHPLKNYALQISADKNTLNSSLQSILSNINLELFSINHFEKLPTDLPPTRLSRNLVPDYINYLLESWKKYGKKPNFIFVGDEVFNFDFIVDQLNSFIWIKGQVKVSGKNLEKVYWKNPDVLLTGGIFSFPYRGGEEITLSPFAPGYKMTPEQIIVTGEMAIPESYSILATPLDLNVGLTGKFGFDGEIKNEIYPEQKFEGNNFSIVQDIERGNVLRLPENASINLGNPETYGLRNSSFTVSCFVKFSEILEFGDNAVLGNYESGYRRGLHLILRSGHPYFGLWANDFVSEKKLEPNIWYHLAWRYIVETGEQSIFLDGLPIGASDGHPPYSGTGDIHLGSALSSGASLRGYIDNLHTWNRPLANEEINRLSLDEEIGLKQNGQTTNGISKANILLISVVSLLALASVFIAGFLFFRKKEEKNKTGPLPEKRKNMLQLFGELKVTNNAGENITELFTPKVKELFIYSLIHSIRSGIGANVIELQENIWPGISEKKATNNRSVTLNKLRKIITQVDGIEIISTIGNIQVVLTDDLFCDFAEASRICQNPKTMDKQQLVNFFQLVKRGRFLKGCHWPWLDDLRGLTGNQVIDNLLKLATIYRNEGNLKEIENIALRILDYDDLNDEAIYLQIWALQKVNNLHLAKFNFNLFVKKYESSMGEPYPMDFAQFNKHFEKLFS